MSSNIKKEVVIEKSIMSLASGNIDSMDILYETIKTDIYAFALSKVHNKFDADDILQDTLIKIYENSKLYTPLGKPLAWIFTIETNVINRYFQLKNRYDIINDDDMNVIKDEPDQNIRDDITNEYLRSLLSTLNDFEKEVISLHLISNLKFREIAKVLNKPLSTVLSKYNRAIKKLKNLNKGGKIYEK